ncbi:PaREP1 family protein [Thermofilum sp.]|uniref:PaREP1 family protein n=1 Tax=Thermofilum sp. TaxID=1961369 RepID=UPI0038663A09
MKALSLATELEEAGEARARGRWTLKLLDSAARKLAEKISEDILYAWDAAYYLHVEGFHEARLSQESVKARTKLIEKLLEISKEKIRKKTGSPSPNTTVFNSQLYRNRKITMSKHGNESIVVSYASGYKSCF